MLIFSPVALSQAGGSVSASSRLAVPMNSLSRSEQETRTVTSILVGASQGIGPAGGLAVTITWAEAEGMTASRSKSTGHARTIRIIIPSFPPLLKTCWNQEERCVH